MQHFTSYLLVSFIIGICLVDVFLYKILGNNYTISFDLLSDVATNPIIAFLIVYTLSLLSGHFTLPKFEPAPELFYHLLYIFIALLPTLTGLIYIWIYPLNLDSTEKLRELFHCGEWKFFFGEVIVSAIGLLAGKILVPQHIY